MNQGEIMNMDFRPLTGDEAIGIVNDIRCWLDRGATISALEPGTGRILQGIFGKDKIYGGLNIDLEKAQQDKP